MCYSWLRVGQFGGNLLSIDRSATPKVRRTAFQYELLNVKYKNYFKNIKNILGFLTYFYSIKIRK